ncbi:hypothetical protein SAMN05421594_0289 [Chryseobacterium oleae]|uniref:Uncharacterized protein n=1 Tax=Chryseobacterium oleae TaxID=491207 RepID=A0A1I4VH16_CHROL|nr:hypothetical protein [Chryseobacterium oleae]SFN00489.1 hypothetical protein SAMN05421594_0289 [Chryseobacterium oleae]
MKEKVYSIDNYWDMTVIEGMADFKDNPCYFVNIFSENQNDWTDEYLLTLLPEDILILGKEVWKYWLYWLATSKETKIPHPHDYADQRKNKSFENLLSVDQNPEEYIKAEHNYQNQIVFNDYLQSNSPTMKAKGLFSGKIDGTETFVEWLDEVPLL